MRKNEFIEYVRSPENITCDQTVELQKISRDFPWFQSAHVLLCRNLNACGNMGFEKQLRIAAAYSADRIRLHQVVIESVAREEDLVLAKKEKSGENKEKPEETKEKKIESIPGSFQPEKKADAKHPEDEFLERQILSHAISNSNLLEAEINTSAEEYDLPQKIEIKKESPTTPDDFEASAHSFTDWLKHLNKEEEDSHFLGEIKKSNRFLPEAPKEKTNFYDPTKMAKLSVKEDDDLITETLAKIYAQQGNIEKAINAYKKLSLKYPEKKFYFANQIKTLEKTLYT